MYKEIRFILLVFTLLNFLKMKGQVTVRDSIGEVVYSEFMEMKPQKNEYAECDFNMRTAKRMCDKDSIFLPRYTRYIANGYTLDINTPTCIEILKREYGFLEKSIIKGDIIPSAVFCFEEYTVRFVQNKFGVTFFRDRKKEADNLDLIGMGYIDAQPKKPCNSLEKILKKKIKSSKKIFEDNKILRIVSLNVLENGNISEIEFKAGYIGGGVVKLDIKDDKYEEKILKVIKEINWSPAILREKPVSSKITFVINEDMRVN